MRPSEFDDRRLKRLHDLDILDSGPEPGFDAITRLAAHTFKTPISTVALIDSERAWFKSRVGVDVCEVPRDAAFCGYAIRNPSVTIVRDATKDPVFANHPAVTGEAHIRFYLGAPVRYEGVTVGILCVADMEPRPDFTAKDALPLHDLAETVSAMMAMRKDGLIKRDIIRLRNETQKKLEMMEAAAGVGYWHVDLETKHAQWSKGVFAILGEPNTFQPKFGTGLDRYHPDDRGRIQACLDRAMQQAEDFSIEARALLSDGVLRVVKIGASVECDSSGRPVSLFGILEDITEQKSVEDALRAAAKAAEDYAQAQSDFVSNMSHEIRTPLTAIIGFSNLLAEMEHLPPDARKCIDRVQKGGRTLLSLVNDVLDFAKLEAGQVELDPRPTNLREVVDDICAQFSPQAEAKGIALRYEYPNDCPETVYIDEVRLIQVLNNLVSNACKFTKDGAITVQVAASPGPEAFEFEISVSDTGTGISTEQQRLLFERFSQADRSIHRKHGGTGLGLAICKEIASLMHGNISVSSQLGQGSRFELEFPALAAPDIEANFPAQYRDAILGRHILLADDHAATLDMVTDILQRAGAVVATASGGAQAIARCRVEKFDAVLMDLHMADVDGITATKAIRESCLINAATPVLAFTADASVKLDEDSLFQDVLFKPLEARSFMRALSIACG